jgi:penicillin amidase
VTAAETWDFAGLEGEVHVLRTEGNVPHIYATNRRDLSFVHGFVLARDRYFMMDLTRRLGRGRTSELIGDSALDVDIESRLTGMTHVANRLADNLTAEQRELADAFAAGINEYIARAAARQMPLPSELRLAGPLLGASNPATLMVPFTYRDVASILAVIMYQSSYETGDVGRDATLKNVGQPFTGDPFEELRMSGLLADVMPSIDPVHPVSSAAGFGLETGDGFVPGPLPADVPGATVAAAATMRRASRPADVSSLFGTLADRLEAFETRLGRFEGFGSNSWAVSGAKTDSGATLLAGDGHLGLDVPPIFFQVGFDTTVFGGGSLRQVGLTIPGFLVMPVGTNGNVAWCQTQLSADATDWYAEQIRLDANGVPEASLFQGEWKPLGRVDETFVIANVPALDSVGRTEVWPRFTIFDGRFISAIEGRRVSPGDPLEAGESLVMTFGGFVVPKDTNSDGVISAVSFDFTGLDVGSLMSATDGFGLAGDVEEFRQNARGLVGYSQNIVAADKDGGILYTAKDAVPCRGYLPRNPDGSWIDGADPRRVLDGTTYGGFEVPLRDGVVDETASGGDPQRCLVPFDSTPQSLDPDRGYVLTANNDPGNIGTDSSLENDPWYIGGPWEGGFRADTIDRTLAALTESGEADLDAMARLQGNHESRLGELFAPRLIEAIQAARHLTMIDRILTADEERLAALYGPEAEALNDVEQRLAAWGERGWEALSGVATFYHTPVPGEADDAVATMIFNAWFGRFMRGVWNDEGFNGGLFQEGDFTRVKLIDDFLESRDAGESRGIASYNEATGESIFFDVRGTEPVERSREIMLAALRDGLDFLRSPQQSPGNGGFGNDDMSTWLWGLRHQVRFESLLAPFLGNDPTFEVFTRPFNIDTNKLPLAPNLPATDPRFGLRWFPRPGDQWAVDAANPGLSGTSFSHGSGPVMRMIFSLKEGEVRGLNVIPGGQSGLTDSPFFTDQAALWLANDAYPIRFAVGDVVEGATKREVYRPAP